MGRTMGPNFTPGAYSCTYAKCADREPFKNKAALDMHHMRAHRKLGSQKGKGIVKGDGTVMDYSHVAEARRKKYLAKQARERRAAKRLGAGVELPGTESQELILAPQTPVVKVDGRGKWDRQARQQQRLLEAGQPPRGVLAQLEMAMSTGKFKVVDGDSHSSLEVVQMALRVKVDAYHEIQTLINSLVGGHK